MARERILIIYEYTSIEVKNGEKREEEGEWNEK
jgi:hypothetical protein